LSRSAPFLGPQVAQGFRDAITARSDAGQVMEIKLEHLKDA